MWMRQGNGEEVIRFRQCGPGRFALAVARRNGAGEQLMTKIELKAFRKTLESRKQELGQGARNREALAIETSSDVMDRVQLFSERDYAMNTLERNSNRLREVEAAIRRLDDGTFGACVNCDEEIPPKRLAVLPWASCCVACQEAADASHTSPGEEMDDSIDMAA
jgi:DnaK suppressor protein